MCRPSAGPPDIIYLGTWPEGVSPGREARSNSADVSTGIQAKPHNSAKSSLPARWPPIFRRPRRPLPRTSGSPTRSTSWSLLGRGFAMVGDGPQVPVALGADSPIAIPATSALNVAHCNMSSPCVNGT